MLRSLFLSAALACTATVGLAAEGDEPSTVKWHPGHYVFVGHSAIGPEHIHDGFRGVQKCYAWKLLEPAPGQFDFSAIKNDLVFLGKHGKRLVIQVQYKAFGKGARHVPDYLRGPEFGGGVYRANSGSFDPVIWNAGVGERMDSLFAALGRDLDREPALEAIVLPETAPSADLVRRPQEGIDPYTPAIYVQALKDRMTALKKAFPHTAVIQYANFPQNMLPELTDFMKDIGVGLGGPDVYPRPSNLGDSERGVYRLYAKMAGVVPLGAAVQSPDYSVAAWKRTAAFNRGEDRSRAAVAPDEEIPIPVREHLKLAKETLQLNYLFWSVHPRANFENVIRLLAEPDLAGDPAGGLQSQLPTKAFGAGR